MNKKLSILRLLRPHQWIKNLFVFAPLVFSGQFLVLSSIESTILAFILFCLGSSAIYIVNDLHDIEADRNHPVKRRSRPLASGEVSISMAFLLIIILWIPILLIFFIAPKIAGIICFYTLINLAYTFWLKNQPVLDIFTIAVGFVLRVYAGALSINVPVSNWMFITTLCLALFLASIKRRQEILKSGTGGRSVLSKYSVPLIDRYAEISGSGALIFYSLFVMSSKPALVMTIPFVIFGIFRYWFLVEKNNKGESPTDALLTDYQLIINIIIWVIFCVLSFFK
jgi:decaprenyl-phosphate phosphoribosyltransferase